MSEDNSLVLRKEVQKEIKAKAALIRSAMPEGVDFDKMVARASIEIQSNPTYTRDPPVDPVSVFWGLVNIAKLGLQVGSDEAYLVPFRKRDSPKRLVNLIIGYKGLVKLAYQHPDIVSINANVICEHDDYEIELGSEQKISFKPRLLGDRGEVIGAFCVINISRNGNTGKVIELMTRSELDKVRNSSKGSQDSLSPWHGWFEQMAVKTVLRRGLKKVPRSEKTSEALRLDDSAEQHPTVEVIEATDASSTKGRVAQLASKSNS